MSDGQFVRLTLADIIVALSAVRARLLNWRLVRSLQLPANGSMGRAARLFRPGHRVRVLRLRIRKLLPRPRPEALARQTGSIAAAWNAKAWPWLLGDAGLRRTQACAVSGVGSNSCRLPRPA